MFIGFVSGVLLHKKDGGNAEAVLLWLFFGDRDLYYRNY
jgi:hypothetical protein